MPHRLEFQQRRIRILLWRTVIAMLKEAHHASFPKGRRFGADIQLELVYGAALHLYLEGKKVRAAAIARYLEMPHETVRRHLKTIVKLKLLEPEDHTFKPSASIRLVNLDRVETAMRRLAREML